MRKMYRGLTVKPEGSRPRGRCFRWEDNIQIDIEEIW
jgi:hypothetical protein